MKDKQREKSSGTESIIGDELLKSHDGHHHRDAGMKDDEDGSGDDNDSECENNNEKETTAGSGACGSGMSSDDVALKNLLDNYHSNKHYSKCDMKDMGKDSMIALFHYSNLDNDGNDEKKEKEKEQEQEQKGSISNPNVSSVPSVVAEVSSDADKYDDGGDNDGTGDDGDNEGDLDNDDVIDTTSLVDIITAPAMDTAVVESELAPIGSNQSNTIVEMNHSYGSDMSRFTHIFCAPMETLGGNITHPCVLSREGLMTYLSNDHHGGHGSDDNAGVRTSDNDDGNIADNEKEKQKDSTLTPRRYDNNIRLRYELLLRKSFNNDIQALLQQQAQSHEDANFEGNGAIEGIILDGSGDEGSDSDPSVNDLSEKEMSKFLGKTKKGKKSGSIRNKTSQLRDITRQIKDMYSNKSEKKGVDDKSIASRDAEKSNSKEKTSKIRPRHGREYKEKKQGGGGVNIVPHGPQYRLQNDRAGKASLELYKSLQQSNRGES